MNKDREAEYLATGAGEAPANRANLDKARQVLSSAATWGAPPDSVAEEVLEEIRARTNPFQEPRRRISPMRLLAAMMTLGAILLVTVLGLGSLRDGTRVDLVGTELLPTASGTAWLRPTDAGWSIRIDLDGLPPAGAGYYYEGWVWSDDGDGVSIGTFHLRNGRERLSLWSGVDVASYPSIWISLQAEGGGPAVSDEILMRGRLDPGDEDG
ncbi:MAG: anti-sigma factor [Acidimicrobiia bacterium]